MRFLRDLFLKNFTLKLAAIISSIAIWIYADGKTSSTGLITIKVSDLDPSGTIQELVVKVHASRKIVNALPPGFTLIRDEPLKEVTSELIKDITGHKCVIISVTSPHPLNGITWSN